MADSPALARLRAGHFNTGDWNAGANPGGMGGDGHRYAMVPPKAPQVPTYPVMVNDVVAVVDEVVGSAEAAEAQRILAQAAATLAQAWAEGTAPGGDGTFSAQGHAAVASAQRVLAEAAAALAQAWAEGTAPGGGGTLSAREHAAVASAQRILAEAARAAAEAAAAAAAFMSPMTSAGDLIIGSAGGAPARLAAGAAGRVLRMVAGLPTWEALAAVAVSGAYGDLSGRPSLATVALSGSYGDLSGRPTLGSAAAQNTTSFASAAQGATADGALSRAGGTMTGTVSFAPAQTFPSIVKVANGATVAPGEMFLLASISILPAGWSYIASPGSLQVPQGQNWTGIYNSRTMSTNNYGGWVGHASTSSSVQSLAYEHEDSGASSGSTLLSSRLPILLIRIA